MLIGICRRTILMRKEAILASSRYKSTIPNKPLNKILVANRGEIAIRVFRALWEMNITSVAVYAQEDRHSLHRTKADFAYQIGKGKGPVEAYLDMESIVKTAVEHKVDAIHPGYGFLSERADFARLAIDNGIAFIGPSPDVMARMGDKVAARKSAIEAGVKVVPGTDFPITSPEEALAFAKEHGCPIILKAAYGGGGRGMRMVESIEQIPEAFATASREALSNFGNGAMFVEKFLKRPRHIEVQILGDHHGNVVHLYERDCSVQRRHQKVVEIAPAAHLDEGVRSRILADAVKLVTHVGYQNAGTVEFLLDSEGNHYFIEVNARLQVEHTVSEEITGVDLVQSQIRIAEGKSLPSLGLKQENIHVNGAAIQCRITSEDPTKNFQPDSGRLEVYRTASGMGIRIDDAVFHGATVLPYYDSLLCKVISHAQTHEDAAKKLERALRECRIRGLKINKPFLLNVVSHPQFLKGAVDTSFIDENPSLMHSEKSRNRGMKLVNFLGEVKVNGSLTPLATSMAPCRKQPEIPDTIKENSKPTGWRDILKKEGPSGFAKAIRNHKGLLITDTTSRDAHQSLMATRVRTTDLLQIAPHISHNMSQLVSLENWGGATFDVCMQFLRECPWERLEELRSAIPNIPFQCLVRGSSALGYSHYPNNVIDEFCKLSVQSGMDIFRVFDCLNYLPNMIPAIKAIGNAGGVVQAVICYSGDMTDPNRDKYKLDYYLKMAAELVKQDIHMLTIKSMSGTLKPDAARILVSELRSRYPDLPINIHTHDTGGVGVASMLAAAEAGADGVDAAIDSMSGITSQPSMGAIVHVLQNTDKNTGMCTSALSTYNSYWEQARRLYAPFECTTTMRSGNSDVFKHEIPGGQYTNLQFQSVSLGLASQFSTVCENYYQANLALGDIIKVTPSSKVVGDLAQFMTQHKISTKEELVEKAETLTFPSSVVDFLEGKLGQPAYGIPEELQKKVLRGKKPVTESPGASMKPLNFAAIKKDLLAKYSRNIRDQDVMSYVMFPREFDEMVKFQEKYGPVTKLPTDVYFAGLEMNTETEIEIDDGKVILLKLLGVGDLNPADGTRDVNFDYNNQHRRIKVVDKSAIKNVESRKKADIENTKHAAAPMKGSIMEIKVRVGDLVKAKQTLCVLSAMKMEMPIEAKTSGRVKEILVSVKDAVDADDLIVVLE